MFPRSRYALATAAALLVSPGVAPAQSTDESPAEAAFYRAAYLQNEQRDYAAAAEQFALAAASSNLDPELARAAQRRLAECQEDLVAADLASLMPPDALVYVQLANLGDQALRFLELTGLAGDDGPGGKQDGGRIALDEGLSLPIDFQLSPALVRELGKAGGAAAALVGISDQGLPEGIVVVHLGDSDLLRGLLETGVQVLPPQESLGGYATYRIDVDGVDVWMARTARLMMISTSREQVAAAAGRLRAQSSVESLSSTSAFRDAAEDRGASLLYAWANSQRAAPLVERFMRDELHGEELLIAQTVLNLRQVEYASFSAGANESGLTAETVVRFTPDHQHLLYGLIRTASISPDAWALAPKNAAAVLAVGLNPPSANESGETTERPQSIALMDFGREIFANLESATMFVVPGKGPMPDVGLALKARDAEKSQRLWNELLSLPSRLGVLPPTAAGQTEIAGYEASIYRFPDAPPIVVVAAGEGALLCGAAGAVEASLTAIDSEDAVNGHPLLGSMIEKTGVATSKALYVSAAGVLRCATQTMGSRGRREAEAIAPILKDTVAGFTVDEGPDELRIRFEVAGVPRVADVLREVGRLQGVRTAYAGPVED